MSSTATNKQPLLVDRPLFDSVRVTTQTVGSASSNTLFVQGGQGPSILVDMDAALSEDTNNGGVVDSITIVRNDFYRAPDYTYTGIASSGQVVSFVSGQIIQITAVTGIGTASLYIERRGDFRDINIDRCQYLPLVLWRYNYRLFVQRR